MASRRKSTNLEKIVAKVDIPAAETATEIATDELVSEVRPEKEETKTEIEETTPVKPQKIAKKTQKSQKSEEKKP